ncbi:MAG: hypothetical protein HY781_13960 [Chloroflexi bacterium]|nr:hypothetical protein [Chloroflexota bacterium]
MKPVHIPRTFAALFLILLVVVFLTGTVLAFKGVHAAPGAALALTATSLPTFSPSATPEQEEGPVSADTTGILALGILLVAVILIGLLWGSSKGRR